MKKYLVVHCNGGRIGSLALTTANRLTIEKAFHLSLIQIDVTGTEHWNLIGYKRKGKRK